MDNPTFLAGGGGNNWLGGIELRMDLFQGGAKRAALSRERALAEKIAALKQAANDAVRLEVRQAYYDQDSSRQQVEVARAAISQAQESLRINQDRYDSGLLTITDLLGAEEAARRSQADYWLLSAVCLNACWICLHLRRGSGRSPLKTRSKSEFFRSL
jgi:outer membrane protein